MQSQIAEISPNEQHAAHELHNAQELKQSQSQVAEINTIHVAARRAQRNSQEFCRSQQLGNENYERLTQDNSARSQS